MIDNTQARHTVVAYIRLFNQLDQLSVERLSAVAAPTVRFIDPFNDVTGYGDMMRVLQHFSDTVTAPHFNVSETAFIADTCFLRWEFSGTLKQSGKPWCFPGVSELTLDTDYRVIRHQDHWDAATHFYEKLPLLGSVIRLIKRRIRPL